MSFRIAFNNIIDEELILMDEIKHRQHRLMVMQLAAQLLDQFAITVNKDKTTEGSAGICDRIVQEFAAERRQVKQDSLKLDVLELIIHKLKL